MDMEGKVVVEELSVDFVYSLPKEVDGFMEDNRF